MRIPKILLGKVSCRKKFEKIIYCAVRTFSVAKVHLFLLDFPAKTRKFAYRWPTLNLNCAKTVTDRNMGFSPISPICPEDVSIGSACHSNTYCICRRKFMSYFCPEFRNMSEMVMFPDRPRTGYTR